MTTRIEEMENESGCPAEGLLKMLSGKWKPQIFKLALEALPSVSVVYCDR